MPAPAFLAIAAVAASLTAITGTTTSDASTTTTTVAAATTSTVPTSAPPSSDAASGSTTTTTIPHGTIVPTDLTAEEQLIADRAIAAHGVFLDSGYNPDAPGLADRVNDLYISGGQAVQALLDDVAFLREEGLAIRPNPDPNKPSLVIIESVTITEPGARAELIVCAVNGDIIYEPGGAPDGSDAIVNDDVGAERAEWTMLVHDGVWKLFWKQRLSENEVGANRCRPQ